MSGPELADRAWIVGLPKAEIHLHLEGSVPPSVVIAAAARHGVAPPGDLNAPVGDGAAAEPRTHDLAGLLAYLDASCGLLDRADDLVGVAYDLATRVSASGTRHVDVIVNPTHWPTWRPNLEGMFDALDAGFSAAEHDGGATAVLCVSLARTQTRSGALELVERLVGIGHRRVAALSIDGDESSGSHTDRFVDAFAAAGAAGLRRCAHAGESSGPSGVREAIDLLGAERIDHGIRSIEDRDLVVDLARRGIPLDICPTSNVVLGYVRSVTAHPVDQLYRAGVAVTLNTDDPLLYGVDLAGEYERCATAFGWTRTVLAALARTSIAASFADETRRRDLLAQLDRFLAASS